MNENKKVIEKYIEHSAEEEKDRKLTEQEIEDNYVDFIAFYRANLNVFNEDYLGIKLAPFQEFMLDVMDDYDIADIIASRGLSKSFITALRAVDVALLYPNSEILVTSLTMAQSNLLINEKIKNMFCAVGNMFSSPVLCKLREEKWITFTTDEHTGGIIVKFGNNSFIKAVVCGESTRGSRATYVITDEFMLVKKKDYDEIIEPTLHPRGFPFRPVNYPEQPQQTFLSSARNKQNWGWTHLKNCVKEHYKGHSQGFYVGDIFTAVANGILTPQQYYQRKKNTDDLSFQQEFLNIFLGNNDDSIFKYEDFENNQTLEEAFYPRTKEDVMYKIPQKYKFKDNEIRFIVSDIAVVTGDENDNTVIMLGKINTKTGQLSVEYLETQNGMNSNQQVILMKRYFYEYKCDYFVIDARGVGAVLWDLFTVETFDAEFGMTYPAWTVNTDKELQISSDTVINDKLERAISKDASRVMIPYVGTAELNSLMHLTTRKTLKDGAVSLLIDDYDKKGKLEDADPKFIMKSAEEKANILIPFMQTRYMINEAVALEVKFTETGLIKVQEAKRTATKDRYMTFGMFCLFGDKLYNKYCKQDTDNDNIDWDEINLVY